MPFEFRTPSPPPISKDSMFYLFEEVEEARRNLEAWWAQGGPEVKEGISKSNGNLTFIQNLLTRRLNSGSSRRKNVQSKTILLKLR